MSDILALLLNILVATTAPHDGDTDRRLVLSDPDRGVIAHLVHDGPTWTWPDDERARR